MLDGLTNRANSLGWRYDGTHWCLTYRGRTKRLTRLELKDAIGYHPHRMTPIRRALALAERMTDRELQAAIGDVGFAIAAILTGRRTAPDLAGRRHRYALPPVLPWGCTRRQRREARQHLLLSGWTKKLSA